MSIEIGFILKKILSALLMPLSLGLILLALGLYFFYKNKNKKAKWLLSISFLWLTLISYAPVANTLLTPLEQQYPKLTKELCPPNIEYIVLLGGDATNRAWEALRLYHLLPNIKIITTGYARYDNISDAKKSANLLKQSAIPIEDIIVYEKPKDTIEEVMAVKELLGNKAFILITSAYHLPRAIKLFKAKGLYPIPAPTDWRIEKRDSALSIPDGKQLYKTQRAWHEYLGLIWSSI